MSGIPKALDALKAAHVRTPKGFKKVLSVAVGFGTDLHGQDPTVAAAAAVKDAMSRTSLPGIQNFVPGGTEGVKVKVKIAVPNPTKVDQAEIKQLLLAKNPEIKVVTGGMRWQSGIIAPKLGDPKPEEVEGEIYSSDEEDEISANKPYVSAADDFLAAVAAVRVGY